MIIDEKELIALINYMEVFNDSENIKNMRVSFINTNVMLSKHDQSQSIDLSSPLVTQIKNKYTVNNHINIIYPFNHIFEYILLNDDYHKLVNDKDKIMEDIDEVYNFLY